MHAHWWRIHCVPIVTTELNLWSLTSNGVDTNIPVLYMILLLFHRWLQRAWRLEAEEGRERRVELVEYLGARHCARWDSICLLTLANVTVLRLSSGVTTSLLLFYYTF